ncbi:MAG: ThiF family adenylyltransferase [Thermoplasmata archaeon]
MSGDMERYDRQLILPQIGEDGQERLNDSKAAVVGMGALGCLSSIILARAGMGHLSVIDRDVVELDNLQRQLLYHEGDLGEAKAIVAARRLKEMNSAVDVQSFPSDLIPRNIDEMLGDADVVVDGLDNMRTRFIINDFCVKNGIPFVYAGAVATYGMTMTIVPGRTACFECLFPSLPPAGSVATCETEGILNTVPATISSIQAADVFRLILGEEVGGRLLTYDAWLREINQMDISKNEDCPSCGKREFRYLSEDDSDLAVSLCGRNSVSISPKGKEHVDFDTLGARLQKVGETRRGEGILAFAFQDYRMTIFQDGRVLISGTGDVSKARSLYSRFIGD